LLEVSSSDEKSRGISAREASRLRPTLGSEPSSGYAYHDASRVERGRPARPDERAPAQTASHAPREGSFQHTLVGVTVQEALAAQAARESAANDQGGTASGQSWPALPHVPNELEGAIGADAPTAADQDSRPAARSPSLPTTSTTPPVGVSGGAIWQALPSVVESAPAVIDAPLDAADTEANSHSRPAGDHLLDPQRSSLAELKTETETEHASAYGDARLVKYEALVARTAWEQLQVELDREGELSPVLELLRIIARRETLKDDERQSAALLSQQAIVTLARLLELPEASPTALLLGKRLLRRNPGWGRVPTPGTGLSAGMLLAGIAAGAGIGWLVTRLIL
jgi:hypothetical protein